MSKLKYMRRDLLSFFRRNAAVIAGTIIALCIVGIFILQSITIGQLQSTVEQQNHLVSASSALSQQLVKASQQRTNQINDVNRHLDCIVQFFAQPDRGNKAIDDIETCRISTTSTGQTAPTGSQTPTTSSSDSAPQKAHQPSTSQQPATSANDRSATTPEKKGLMKTLTDDVGDALNKALNIL